MVRNDRPAPSLGHGGHPALFRRLDALMGRLVDAGKGREATGVVAAIFEVRSYLRDHLDVDLSDPGPPSQFGDLPS